MEQPTSRVAIKEIGRVPNITPSTVSFALSGCRMTSGIIGKAAEKIPSKLDYQPNKITSCLRIGKYPYNFLPIQSNEPSTLETRGVAEICNATTQLIVSIEPRYTCMMSTLPKHETPDGFFVTEDLAAPGASQALNVSGKEKTTKAAVGGFANDVLLLSSTCRLRRRTSKRFRRARSSKIELQPVEE